MNDNDMTNILKNFAAAEDGKVVDAATGELKQSTAASEKNAMKALLEGLDSAQRSVNQMPATHKMAKSTDTAHPASNFLVGGEDGEPEAGDEVVSEAPNLRTVKVTYSNGDSVTTDMAAGLSDEQIHDYFAVGKRFNLGNPATGGDNVQTVTDVEILDQVTEIDEVDDGDPVVTMDDVVETWKSVFPNSSVAAGKSFGGGYSFKFRLSSGPEEVANGIMDNDPLGYTAFLEPNGGWRETASSMLVAPEEGSHMAYSSVKFRKKKAKNVTVDQLHKRFMQVKDFVIANADRLHNVQFDILDKITEAAFGERKPAEDVHKKQSLADIFRSMDETEEDLAARFQKELHADRTAKELNKGDNGKFNLAEEPLKEGTTTATLDKMVKDMMKVLNRGKTAMVTATRVRGVGQMEGPVIDYEIDWKDHYDESINEEEELTWGDEMIEDLKLLLQDSADGRIDLREELHKLIAIYEK